MKKLLILAFLLLSTAVFAQDSGRGPGGAGDIARTRSASVAGAETINVPKPETLALLGMGLASLGIYARRKQGKRTRQARSRE